jgi:hypothetical protein
MTAMNNLLRALTPEYPEYISAIREALARHPNPLLHRTSLSDIEVERVWKRFSSDLCASYMSVNKGTVEQFLEWLQE